MAVLVPYLIGAATTLVVQAVIQFFIVPRVETRKRREDRWEHNVLELGGLLTTAVGEGAQEVRVQQSVFRGLREKQSAPEFDQVRIEQGLDEVGRKAQELTWAFRDLVRARVYWLTERIVAVAPEADEIAKLWLSSARYLVCVMDIAAWSKNDDRTEEAFEEVWQKEWNARQELIKQVKVLADMQHLPRVRVMRRFSASRRRVQKRARPLVSGVIARGRD